MATNAQREAFTLIDQAAPSVVRQALKRIAASALADDTNGNDTAEVAYHALSLVGIRVP